MAGRLVGNFPQAFSHVSLINSAFRLSGNDPLAPVLEPKELTVDRSANIAPVIQRMKRMGRVTAARRRAGASG